jgi:PAS domain S-box-containing protein
MPPKRIETESSVRAESTALLEQEQRVILGHEFSELVSESLAFPYMVIDARDFTIRKANPAAGLRKAQEGVPCYKVLHNRAQPCQASEIICPVEQVRQYGKSCVLEHLHRDKQGNVLEYSEIHAHPVYDPEGILAQVITCTIDKTKHKKNEMELRKSAAKYRSLFEGLPIGVCLLSFEGKILQCNAAMSRLTGCTEEQLITMKVREFLQGWQEYDRVWEKLKTREGFVHNGEAELRDDNTPVLYVRITMSRFALDGSMVVLASFVDVSQQKKAQTELENSLEAVERKNVALTELSEQIEIQKSMLTVEIAANLRELVFPILEKLRLSQTSNEYIDLLEHRIRGIADKFGITIEHTASVLSPRETEICTLIQSGMTSKEIAQLLGVSYQTVEKHRRNIRKKIGLSRKKVNLASYLQHDSSP